MVYVQSSPVQGINWMAKNRNPHGRFARQKVCGGHWRQNGGTASAAARFVALNLYLFHCHNIAYNVTSFILALSPSSCICLIMRPFTEVDHILVNIFLKEILFTTETSNARSSQVRSANRRNKWHRTQSRPIKSHDHPGPIKYWSLWTQLKCGQYLTIFLGFPWALLGGLVTYTNALTSSHVWLHQLLSRVSMPCYGIAEQVEWR